MRAAGQQMRSRCGNSQPAEIDYERSMNQGSNPPSGQPGGGKGRRRRRGRRGPVTQGAHPLGQGQGRGPQQGPGQQRHGKGRKGGRPGQRSGQNQPGGGIYTAPMDHSYRAAQNNNNGNQQRRGVAVGARISVSNSCRSSLNRCPSLRKRGRRASMPSSTICSSSPRSRRRAVS